MENMEVWGKAPVWRMKAESGKFYTGMLVGNVKG